MKRLTNLLGFSKDDLVLDYFVSTLKLGLLEPHDLNNYDKCNKLLSNNESVKALERILFNNGEILTKNDRDVVLKVLAINDKTMKINTLHRDFDSNSNSDLTELLKKSTIVEFLSDNKITDIKAYLIGVIIGMGTNGRKNRTGHKFKEILKQQISKISINEVSYLSDVKIKDLPKYGWEEFPKEIGAIHCDFIIKNNSRYFVVKSNFYATSGGIIKSTCKTAIEMSSKLSKHGVDFIWITDGGGLTNNKECLNDFYKESPYMINLEMIYNGVLSKIIS